MCNVFEADKLFIRVLIFFSFIVFNSTEVRHSYAASNKTGGGQFNKSVKRKPAIKRVKRKKPRVVAKSIGGQWKSSTAGETLSFPNISSGTLTASYSPNSGKIYGKLRSGTLNGIWVEAVSTRKCDKSRRGSPYWGRIEFRFNRSRTRFSGKWGHCDGALHSSWSGTKN